MTSLLHIVTTDKDGVYATTACGIRFITDHKLTEKVRAEGDWATCPLCLAAQIVNNADIDERETQS